MFGRIAKIQPYHPQDVIQKWLTSNVKIGLITAILHALGARPNKYSIKNKPLFLLCLIPLGLLLAALAVASKTVPIAWRIFKMPRTFSGKQTLSEAPSRVSNCGSIHFILSFNAVRGMKVKEWSDFRYSPSEIQKLLGISNRFISHRYSYESHNELTN